jgi:hypothetical protein
MNLNMLKKKRKADEAFDYEYEYVYGIVTTGENWLYGTVFSLYVSLTSFTIS